MPLTIVPFLNRVAYYILNPAIQLLFALSFVYFIYGIIKFIQSDAGDKGAGRVEARNAILWGLIGMLVMFSVFGIIRIVLYSFGINTSDPSLQNTKTFLHLL